MRHNKTKAAFSLIELSIVILIIGLLIQGVIKGRDLLNKMELTAARNITTNSPIHRTKDLLFWYETTSQDAFLEDDIVDDNLIENWNDNKLATDTQYNLTQSSTARQPSYVKNGINGLPSLDFLGIYNANSNNDCMKSAIGGQIILNESHTLFFVGKKNDLDNSHLLKFAIPSGGAAQSIAYVGSSNDFSFVYRHNSSSSGGEFIAGNVSNNTVDKPYILRSVRNHDQQTIEAWLNDSKILDTSTTNLNDYNVSGFEFTVGSNSCTNTPTRSYDGTISEIIGFNRSLKKGEIKAIEDYLSQKYDIKVR